MEIFNQLGIDIGYTLLGLIGVILLLFILIIILMIKQGKLKRKYKAFMSGATGESLEKAMIDKFSQIEKIDKAINVIEGNIGRIDETLLLVYQKIGIVKYDAFKEMGGKLSFALALLNSTNDGFIINSMHSSREGCYTYVKEIIKGESFVLLADEEKQALSEAIQKSNYME